MDLKKINTALLAIIALLIAGLVWVVAHRSDHPMDDMGDHMGHGSSSSEFTGADVMFLQMMIPHHQQAIDISELAMTKSKNPGILDLAARIKSEQAAEIIQMKKWLSDAGASEEMGHQMDDMGGMLSDSELADLKKATGTSFDRLWLQGMIAHHEGAIHMTNMISDAQNNDIKLFGQGIVKVQTAEIQELKALLAKISS